MRLIGEEIVSDRHNERDLKASIRELAAVLERGLDEHPAPAELQDFLAGDLPEDQRERIEEHLALCPTCARAALDLAELPDLEPVRRGELLTESELAAQWERFKTSVAPAPAWKRNVLALAAALLLGIVGLVVWGARELQKPRADVYVAFLDASATRGSSKAETIRHPAWAGRIVFIFGLDTQEFSEYGIEVVAADGRKIWSGRGVSRQDESVAVEIPVRRLPKGTYQIRLSGPQGQAVSEHTIEIEPD